MADQIEAELRRIGWWDLPEPPMDFKKAFGMDVMSFPQWVRFVLVPRIREIVQTQGDPPASSSVGTQAIRELDGDDRASTLVSLLAELDGIILDAASPLDRGRF